MTVLNKEDAGMKMKLRPWTDEVVELAPWDMPKVTMVDINDRNEIMIDD